MNNHIIIIILILLFLITKYYYKSIKNLSILFLIFAIIINTNNQISILLFLIIALSIIDNKQINYKETFTSKNNKELDFIVEDNDLIKINKDKKNKENNKTNEIKDLTTYKIDTDLNKKLDMLNQSLQIFKQKINN